MEVRLHSHILTALALVLLSACFDSHATPADVVGSWVSSDGAVLTFKEDGRFEARGLPRLLLGRDASREPVEGVGSWELTERDGGRDVDLSFDAIAEFTQGYRLRVHMSGRGASLRLYLWEGAPYDTPRYDFVRKQG